MQNKMDELKDKGKKVIENIGEKKHDLIQKWEDKSRDFIDTFLLLFGREGRLVTNSILIYSKNNLIYILRSLYIFISDSLMVSVTACYQIVPGSNPSAVKCFFHKKVN